MKIYKILLFAFAIVLVVFSSCKKEELEETNYTNPNPPVNDLGKLNCFTPSGHWEVATYSASYVNDVVKIEAISSDNDTMIFNININKGQHYYDFNNGNSNLAYVKFKADETTYYNTSLAPVVQGNIGHIDITVDAVNNILSGSFAFKAYKSIDNTKYITITEGNFSNIKYTEPIDLSQNSMSGIVMNDSINAFNPVCASKNYSDYFDIRGVFNTDNYIGLYFNGNGISQGDSIPFGTLNKGIYYDGSSTLTSEDGYVKITQFNDSTKTLGGTFQFYFGTDSVKNGHFNVKYFEQ